MLPECFLLLFIHSIYAILQLHECVVRLPRTTGDEEVVVAESMTTVVSLNQDYKPIPWPAAARKHTVNAIC